MIDQVNNDKFFTFSVAALDEIFISDQSLSLVIEYFDGKELIIGELPLSRLSEMLTEHGYIIKPIEISNIISN